MDQAMTEAEKIEVFRALKARVAARQAEAERFGAASRDTRIELGLHPDWPFWSPAVEKQKLAMANSRESRRKAKPPRKRIRRRGGRDAAIEFALGAGGQIVG